MKTNALRGKIVEKGMNIGQFCEAAGFARTTFDRKLNGRTEFSRNDISRIIEILQLTDEETRNIFFADGVA